MSDYSDYYIDGPGIDKAAPGGPSGAKAKNFHSLPTKIIEARKEHECSWCRCAIAKGETHHYWRSVGDSFTVNRMHGDCLRAAVAAGDFIYKSKKRKRPLQSQGREVPTGQSLPSETAKPLASSGPDEPTPASLPAEIISLLQQAAEALERHHGWEPCVEDRTPEQKLIAELLAPLSDCGSNER